MAAKSTGWFRAYFSVGADGKFLELLAVDAFATHLISDKQGRDAQDYISEEIREGGDWDLVDVVGAVPGVHEVVAEVTAWAHVSFEGEHDGGLNWNHIQHRKLTHGEAYEVLHMLGMRDEVDDETLAFATPPKGEPHCPA